MNQQQHFFVGFACFLTFSCAEQATQSVPTRPSPTSVAIPVDGDSAAPFTLTSTVRGAIEADQPTSVTLAIRADQDVSQLSTALRGISGVEVREGAVIQHGAQASGAFVHHTFEVLAAKGVAGLVAIDLTWTGADGQQSVTLAVPISAHGATAKTPALGKLETDDRGEPVQVMPAEVR